MFVFQDLDNETLAHIDAENRRQTLEEELEFLKQVHEQVGWAYIQYVLFILLSLWFASTKLIIGLICVQVKSNIFYAWKWFVLEFQK